MTYQRKIQIANEFDSLWQRFASELQQTGGSVDMHVSTQSPGLGTVLTTVSRIPSEARSRLSAIQDHFSEFRAAHYFYPLENLHFTIRDCTAFLKNPESPDAADIIRIATRLKTIFSQFQPFTVQLEGLNIFPTTIYIQLFETIGILQEMREAIENELGREYINATVASQRLIPNPLLGFVNIIRFQRPVTRELISLVEKYRDAEIGQFEVNRIELVETDKLLSRDGTTVHQQYSI